MSSPDVYKSKSTTILIAKDPNESNNKLKIWNSSLNLVVHILIGVIVGVTVILVFSFGVPPSWGMLHMLFCVIGYQLLMAQGILSLSPDNGWSSLMKLSDKKRAHWILKILGSGFALIGTIMEIKHNIYSMHFGTLHGLFGLVAMIFTVLSLIKGLNSFDGCYFELGKFVSPKLTKITYCRFEFIAFVTASISLCYGFDMEWFRQWVVFEEIPVILIVFTATFTFIISINPFVSLYADYLANKR